MTIISFFHCSPQIIRDTPGLGDDLRRHGINTLEMQVYRSPANDPDYPTWERNYEAEGQPGWEIDWCVREGWDYVGRLDDAVRTPGERKATWKWDGETLDYVSVRVFHSQRCVGIEVCDEMNPDPSSYPVAQLLYWFDGTPLAFPGLAPQAYERTTGFGDYCSRQWDWWNRTTYPARLKAVKNALTDLPNDNRRVCLMIPVVGAWYSERDGKPGVSPGDVVWNKGMTPTGIGNLMRAARKMVAPREIQYRLYGYHPPFWDKEIAEAKPGHRGRLQRGVSRALDAKRWLDILRECKRITGGK